MYLYIYIYNTYIRLKIRSDISVVLFLRDKWLHTHQNRIGFLIVFHFKKLTLCQTDGWATASIIDSWMFPFFSLTHVVGRTELSMTFQTHLTPRSPAPFPANCPSLSSPSRRGFYGILPYRYSPLLSQYAETGTSSRAVRYSVWLPYPQRLHGLHCQTCWVGVRIQLIYIYIYIWIIIVYYTI